MNKLLKDAIADAKAVRETALANAKAALEEAFAPKLQSMLSHKIKEEMADDEEGAEVSDEDQMEIAKMQQMAGIVSEEGDEMDAEEAPEEAPVEDEMDAEEAPMEDEMGGEEDFESEEEVSDEDLEEILRELEGEEAEDETEGMKMEAEDEENMEAESEDPEAAMDEEIDLDEIIKALKEEDEAEDDDDDDDDDEKESKKESVAAELNEAYGVIKFLRTKLNEVNLLNAKLLYVNKLFRKGELTESQKVKIIETFDRAKNVREAKLIYATLSESVSGKSTKPATPKKKMNEGLASAPQKSTKIITESNNLYNRFKSLVDYNKH